jgi:DNA-binding transcriptional MerR regulator
MISMYFDIVFSSSGWPLPGLAPTCRTSGPRLTTAPKNLRRGNADPAGKPLTRIIRSSPRPEHRGATERCPGMKIGEAARAGGVSARSLRHYEDEGLIIPGRCGNGFRDYCQSTIDRVLIIRSLLESGLPVRLIREALPSTADAPRLSAEFLREVQRHRDRLAARIAVLSEQQAALDAYLRAAT